MEVNNEWIEKLGEIIEEIKSDDNQIKKEEQYTRLAGFCESLVEVYQITIK